MIFKFRRKAVILGRPHLVLAEACTLMFQIRDCMERNNIDAGKVMEIIALAAMSRDEEEHLEKLAERFEKEADEDDHQDQD